MTELEAKREKIKDTRLAVMMIGLIVVAPHLDQYISEVVFWICAVAWLLLREGFFDGVERIWNFISRQ